MCARVVTLLWLLLRQYDVIGAAAAGQWRVAARRRSRFAGDCRAKSECRCVFFSCFVAFLTVLNAQAAALNSPGLAKRGRGFSCSNRREGKTDPLLYGYTVYKILYTVYNNLYIYI